MKIAVLSDIHGNIAALDAVLDDISSRNVDQVVNLGDILSGALFPLETADRLMALSLPTIAGNHERQVLTHDDSRIGPSDRHARHCLRADQLKWLEGLPATLQLLPDVLMVHGTPTNDLQYLLESVTEQGLRPASDGELDERLLGTNSTVVLCGHSHLPWIRRTPNGKLVVNPGSVGLQAYSDDHPFPHKVEAGSPHARYAIITRSLGGWTAEAVCVAYDWETAAIHADANGRPEWGRALRTGRV